MNIKVREAKPTDAFDISRVRIETWRTTYKGIVPDKVLEELNLEEEAKRREKWLANPNSESACFVAEIDDRGIIGFSYVGPIRDKVDGVDGELYAIYVLKEFQGLGIGKSLWKTSFGFLKSRGYSKMLVWVLKKNPFAEFYRRMGGELQHTKAIEIGISLEEDGYAWKLESPRLSGLLVRKATNEEFRRSSEFSFRNFAMEMAKSRNESLENIVSELGGPPIEISSEDTWLTILSDKNQIGFVWIRRTEKPEEAFGYDIYIEPEFRSQGVGRQVMNECRKILEDLGIKTVKICVFEHNKIARSLYSSLGFREIHFDQVRKQYHLEISIA